MTDREIDLGAAIAAADPIALRAALWIQTLSDEWTSMATIKPTVVKSHVLEALRLERAEDIERVRAAALVLMRSIEAGETEPRRPTADEIPLAVQLLTGHTPEKSTYEFWNEEFPLGPQTRKADPIDAKSVADSFPDLNIVIIGAGMGGISSAVMLQAAGIPFTILEKNAGLGGTWYSSTYPGIRVDLPSRAYSYTFESDYLWKNYFAPQAELLEYLNYTVDKRGIREHITFETEVTALDWNEAAQTWCIATQSTNGSTREMHANFVISAVGLFSRPKEADIPGLESFEGVAMHTAHWDHDTHIEGKRVGVVGTGSSGIQVVRALADVASHLTVFQRTASWIGTLESYTKQIPEDERWMIANFPAYVNCVRIMQIFSLGDTRESLNDVDPDWDEPDSVSEFNASIRRSMMAYINNALKTHPELVDKVTPKYPAMAKRIPMDNGWYAALCEDHVDLETTSIKRVVPSGVELESGEVVELDVLVLATGYRANDFLYPMEITGVGGVELSKLWEVDGPRAWLGIMVKGFPNLFCMYGPNTNPTSGGPCLWGELQARFAVESIGALASEGLRSLDIKADVFDEFNDRLDESLSGKVWLDNRQKSYYTNEHGRIVTNAPWKTYQYWEWTRRPNLDQFIVN